MILAAWQLVPYVPIEKRQKISSQELKGRYINTLVKESVEWKISKSVLAAKEKTSHFMNK